MYKSQSPGIITNFKKKCTHCELNAGYVSRIKPLEALPRGKRVTQRRSVRARGVAPG